MTYIFFFKDVGAFFFLSRYKSGLIYPVIFCCEVSKIILRQMLFFFSLIPKKTVCRQNNKDFYKFYFIFIVLKADLFQLLNNNLIIYLKTSNCYKVYDILMTHYFILTIKSQKSTYKKFIKPFF